MHPVDIAVSLFARGQEGQFSVAQAKAAGATDALIWRRRRSGRWVSRAPAVLALHAAPRSDRANLWTALLDAGPRAMASHRTAAALHRLDSHRLAPPSILVPHGEHHDNGLAAVHQTRRMPGAVHLGGVPATPIVRTLLDLSSVCGPVRLGRDIDQAIVALGVSLDAIRDGYEWMHRTRQVGVVTLAAALEGRTHRHEPSRSELERLLDAIIASLPVAPPRHEVSLPTRRSSWRATAGCGAEGLTLGTRLSASPRGRRRVANAPGAGHKGTGGE